MKKLDMLVRAVAELNKQGRKFNLVFVGDGTERESLVELVHFYSIEDCVWFYGACYDEK